MKKKQDLVFSNISKYTKQLFVTNDASIAMKKDK